MDSSGDIKRCSSRATPLPAGTRDSTCRTLGEYCSAGSPGHPSQTTSIIKSSATPAILFSAPQARLTHSKLLQATKSYSCCQPSLGGGSTCVHSHHQPTYRKNHTIPQPRRVRSVHTQRTCTRMQGVNCYAYVTALRLRRYSFSQGQVVRLRYACRWLCSIRGERLDKCMAATI